MQFWNRLFKKVDILEISKVTIVPNKYKLWMMYLLFSDKAYAKIKILRNFYICFSVYLSMLF